MSEKPKMAQNLTRILSSVYLTNQTLFQALGNASGALYVTPVAHTTPGFDGTTTIVYAPFANLYELAISAMTAMKTGK